MSAVERDDLARARANAMAHYESIAELVAETDQDATDERKDEIEAQIDTAYDEYRDAKADIEEEPLDRDDWMDIERGQKSPVAALQAEWDRLGEVDPDSARERIQEGALSVQVRSGWHSPGDSEGAKPEEYEILLTTGGPAARIIGDLNQYSEPSSATLQCQDWFQPWTEVSDGVNEEILLQYARCFWFGE